MWVLRRRASASASASGGPQVLAPQGRVPDSPPRLHLQVGVGAVGFAVRGGAGPGVIVRIGYHSRPDRVKLGVAQRRSEARRIERAGVESALPDVAGGSVARIEVGGIAPVRVLEREAQGVGARGDDDEVDVVGHEAIADQGEAVEPAVLAEEVEVDEAVRDRIRR